MPSRSRSGPLGRAAPRRCSPWCPRPVGARLVMGVVRADDRDRVEVGRHRSRRRSARPAPARWRGSHHRQGRCSPDGRGRMRVRRPAATPDPRAARRRHRAGGRSSSARTCRGGRAAPHPPRSPDPAPRRAARRRRASGPWCRCRRSRATPRPHRCRVLPVGRGGQRARAGAGRSGSEPSGRPCGCVPGDDLAVVVGLDGGQGELVGAGRAAGPADSGKSAELAGARSGRRGSAVQVTARTASVTVLLADLRRAGSARALVTVAVQPGPRGGADAAEIGWSAGSVTCSFTVPAVSDSVGTRSETTL